MTHDPLFRDCRRHWLAGRCPCCGSGLDSYAQVDLDTAVVDRVWQPAAVAEGVEFCGRCIAMRHHDNLPGFLDLMLEALLP